LGLFMVIHRLWQKFSKKHEMLTTMIKSKYFHVFAVFLTFHCWCLSLIFMRSETMEKAMLVMRKMMFVDQAPDFAWWQASIIATSDSILYQILPLLLVVTYAMQIVVSKFKETPGIMPAFNLRCFGIPVFKPAYLAVLLVVLFIWSPDFSPQFIYFQF
ncbi:MAG: hypothetical protein K8F91_01715, partial [Candidatus Obscuribacterales bacterium]|nr:hypothetical protein [Candidatus Obscuribacterales bacterium]